MDYGTIQSMIYQKLKPLAFLPNTAGFSFTGITKDYRRISCTVVFTDGLHRVSGASFSELIGWL